MSHLSTPRGRLLISNLRILVQRWQHNGWVMNSCDKFTVGVGFFSCEINTSCKCLANLYTFIILKFIFSVRPGVRQNSNSRIAGSTPTRGVLICTSWVRVMVALSVNTTVCWSAIGVLPNQKNSWLRKSIVIGICPCVLTHVNRRSR
jgi:hypothetical protein